MYTDLLLSTPCLGLGAEPAHGAALVGAEGRDVDEALDAHRLGEGGELWVDGMGVWCGVEGGLV